MDLSWTTDGSVECEHSNEAEYSNGHYTKSECTMEERLRSLKISIPLEERVDIKIFGSLFSVPKPSSRWLVDSEKIEELRRNWENQDWFPPDQNEQSEIRSRQMAAMYILRTGQDLHV